MNDLINTGFGGEYPELADLDLYGLLPCMLKVPLETEFNRVMRDTGRSPACHFEWQDNLDLGAAIASGAEPARLPGVMITVGVSSMFDRRFMERFVMTGAYRSINEPEVDPALAGFQLLDPHGNFTMIAIDAVVILANLKLAGDLPPPRCWGDFLEPEYADTLAVCGRHEAEGFSPPLLLAIQREFGFAGLRRFAQAVRAAAHPAKLSKLAAGSKPEGAPFNAIPLFFAETVSDRDHMKVIWPEDGALGVPMPMLVRSDANENEMAAARFFTGNTAARICSDARFPALHPKACNRLAGGLKWLGWDQIYDPSYGRLLEETITTFREAWRACKVNRLKAEGF